MGEKKIQEAIMGYTREDVTNMMKAMVFAAIQADGRNLGDVTPDEMDEYVRSAMSDLKLCLDIVQITRES